MDPESVPPKRDRNYGIDACRLFGSIAVINAHGGQFEIFDPSVHTAVSLLLKWSVPFFFIVIGYFISRKKDRNRAVPVMVRMTMMFVLASVLMIPLDLREAGTSGTIHMVSQIFLISGTYFHLWFLSSVIMGLLVIRVTDEIEVPWLLPFCAMAALTAAVFFSTYYWSSETADLGRHLMSIPFLWFGTLLSNYSLSLKRSIGLIAVGFVIEIIEARWIHGTSGRVLWDCPLLIGTVPLAVGMFGAAAHLRSTSIVKTMGRLGARFTGCIYVTHLYFIVLVHSVAAKMGVEGSAIYCTLVVPIIFLSNLLALMLINRYAPVFIDGLLGDKAATQRLAQKIAEFATTVAVTGKTLAISIFR